MRKSVTAASNSAAKARVLQEGAFNMYRAAGELQRAAERRVPFWINLGTEVEFEFAACPAGSFKMGCQGDPSDGAFRHTVNLTRRSRDVGRTQEAERVGNLRHAGQRRGNGPRHASA